MPKGPTPELEAAARAAGINLDAEEEELEPEFEEEEVVEEPTGSEPPETTDSETELPDTFFGHDIKGYREKFGDEAATEYYNALAEADRAANKRIRELSAALKAREEDTQPTIQEPQVEAEEEISDEDLLVRYGMSPDLLQYEDFGKPIVAMLRNQIALEGRLDNLQKTSEAEAWSNQFFGTFDKLQSEYGDLGVDHRTLEQVAVDRNIFDAEALYWLMAGPVNRAAATRQPTTKKQGQGDLRKLKKAVSNTRRRSSAPGSVGQGKPKTLQEAFEAARKSQGISESIDPFAAED